MTTISILGEEINITYNLAVELEFGDIAGQDFTPELLQSRKACVQLYVAAIKANNPDTAITFERLTKEATIEELSALDRAVGKELVAWRKIPVTIKSDDVTSAKPEGEEEDEEKKA